MSDVRGLIWTWPRLVMAMSTTFEYDDDFIWDRRMTTRSKRTVVAFVGSNAAAMTTTIVDATRI
jgi:hypothetical protein